MAPDTIVTSRQNRAPMRKLLILGGTATAIRHYGEINYFSSPGPVDRSMDGQERGEQGIWQKPATSSKPRRAWG